MPTRPKLKNNKLVDLTRTDRDNLAKQKAGEMAAKNILRDEPFVQKEVAKDDLTKLRGLLLKTTENIDTIISNLRRGDDGQVRPFQGTRRTIVTDSVQTITLFERMDDIVSEYDSEFNVDKLDKKEWEKSLKKYSNLKKKIEDLRLLYDDFEAANVAALTRPYIGNVLISADNFNDSIELVNSLIKSFVGSGGQRFYPEDTGVERKLL